MAKLFLRDVGSHPERDLEVTLFKDGELQFEADNGKYVHINITREGVKELVEFLNKELPRAATLTGLYNCYVCSEEKCTEEQKLYLCKDCGNGIVEEVVQLIQDRPDGDDCDHELDTDEQGKFCIRCLDRM